MVWPGRKMKSPSSDMVRVCFLGVIVVEGIVDVVFVVEGIVDVVVVDRQSSSREGFFDEC